MKEPFNFNENVATLLAQLCCHDKALPQGAPTSPVLSNMICARLDRELRGLAKKHRSTYTRYADDITFSTNSKAFNRDIAEYSFDEDEEMTLLLGAKLQGIIEKNGFTVNPDKTRISINGKRKSVTGLIVNEKLNVPRSYVRKVRSMLYAWERFGLEKAQAEYFSRYDLKNRLLNDRRSYKAIVKGKIDYLGLVRGRNDYIFNKFYNRYNRLVGNNAPILPINPEEELQGALFVIKCGAKQGTGFLLRGVGLITCHHVVDAAQGERIMVYRGVSRTLDQQWEARVAFSDPSKDLAIIQPNLPRNEFRHFLKLCSTSIGIDTQLTCIGFSMHRLGESYQKCTGIIDSIRKDKRGNDFLAFSAGLYSGHSGGVALDTNNQVAGVLRFGSAHPGIVPTPGEMGIIPIWILKSFIEDCETYRAKLVSQLIKSLRLRL